MLLKMNHSSLLCFLFIPKEDEFKSQEIHTFGMGGLGNLFLLATIDEVDPPTVEVADTRTEDATLATGSLQVPGSVGEASGSQDTRCSNDIYEGLAPLHGVNTPIPEGPIPEREETLTLEGENLLAGNPELEETCTPEGEDQWSVGTPEHEEAATTNEEDHKELAAGGKKRRRLLSIRADEANFAGPRQAKVIARENISQAAHMIREPTVTPSIVRTDCPNELPRASTGEAHNPAEDGGAYNTEGLRKSRRPRKARNLHSPSVEKKPCAKKGGKKNQN